MSSNYHAVLGIRAVLGRTLFEHDREPLAVISHRYWQRRFAGDPNVVGRVLEMQGRSFTIVGVTPPEFFGAQPGSFVDVTAPLGAQSMTMPPNARWLYLVGSAGAGRHSRAGAGGAAGAMDRAHRRSVVTIASSGHARARFRCAGIERAPSRVLRAASDSDGDRRRRSPRRLRQSRGPADRAIERETTARWRSGFRWEPRAVGSCASS